MQNEKRNATALRYVHRTVNEVAYRGHFLQLNHGEQYHVLPDTPCPVHNVTAVQSAAKIATYCLPHTKIEK